MPSRTDTREIALDILLKINEEGQQSHLVLGEALAKYQYLPRQERAFITRLCQGTLEYQIQLDYIIDSFSKVPVANMKPVIREILRSSVYQLKFMDSVPDSAACNEAVRLAQKKGFYNLKPFVNGVLRTIARSLPEGVPFPDPQKDLVGSLSVCYSMPPFLVNRFLSRFGPEKTQVMLEAFLHPHPLTVRCRTYLDSVDAIQKSLLDQGVTVKPASYLPYACRISGFDYLMGLDAFTKGRIVVQDVASMLAAVCAAPQKGDYCLDLCAAPGGKSLHLGDLMEGYGTVDARDVSEAKIRLIEENIARTKSINVQAKVFDAKVFDPDCECLADVVLADLPCSGLGVIGHKPEIKYRASQTGLEELVKLQRRILDVAAEYVKPRGTLIFSTCTISQEENEENVLWFLNHHPSFELESLDPYLPSELKCDTTALGYLQLLPGIHDTDGFFIARFCRSHRPSKSERRSEAAEDPQ